jgi:sortase (surface protein transpeptidase)
MLIDGHNGGPHVHGVFKNLPELEPGDLIKVERGGDGVVLTYKVYDNQELSLEQSNTFMREAMRSPVSGTESLTLISCTGEWSSQRNTYLSRQFTRALLVSE